MSAVARLSGYVSYHGYRVAERLVCLLPERALPRLATGAGTIAWATMPTRRRVVRRTLERVQGPGGGQPAQVRRAFQSYARYWLDTFRLPVLDPVELDRRADIHGLERVDAALEAGHGAIIALPHMGSWDLAGAWLTGQGYPVCVVMERLEPPRLLDWFVAARARVGMEVVVRGPEVWEELERALARNRLVGLVCDRDLRGRGVAVRFFGEETTLPPGPAGLARRSAAPLLPVGIYAGPGRRWSAEVRPPVPVRSTADERADVAEISQHLARELERLIRRAPTQWHLMQPNWPTDQPAVAGPVRRFLHAVRGGRKGGDERGTAMERARQPAAHRGAAHPDEVPYEDERLADPEAEGILEEESPADVPDEDRTVPEDVNAYVVDEPPHREA